MSTEHAPRELKRLVIVESPAKARSLAGFLGQGFEIEASLGHIRDLPQPSELPADMKKGPFGKFAVNVEDNFEPFYVIDADKKKKVSELRRALKQADELWLATDEDREGEAIAWHLLQALKPTVPVKRMVFHEITREAIQRAVDSTRDIDEDLVNAQETRRILDRLYGYEVSPVLWRKVRAGLSAGRVQSVATRLVVERERERMLFRAAYYWDLQGSFAPVDSDQSFEARLVAVDGVRVATGRDFDDRGQLKTSSLVLDHAAAEHLHTALLEQAATVRALDTKPYRRSPAAPFTTSTVQQEASRKLRWSPRDTMRVAQSLYENGYITYMRTDSTALSREAIVAARRQIEQLYGAGSVPASPRVYANKSKNAQEAHEAIRPAGDSFRTPQEVAGQLRGDEFRLYDLIWKRTIASQMEDARGSTATVRIGMEADDGRDAEFSVSGTIITFRGFLAAYEEGTDEGRDSAEESAHGRLPDVVVDQALKTLDLRIDDHSTNPPPRYTEASLVRALEERDIGRPSTYASTIAVILARNYVTKRGSALVPSWLAFAVTRLLEEHFGPLVNYEFTADLEEDLDAIARGEQERVDWLSQFYFSGADGLRGLVENLGEIDAREINSVPIGNGITLRVGRYGPYLEAPGEPGDEPRRASVPDDVAPDELTASKAKELLEAQADGDRLLGVDPHTGHDIVVKSGRFGPYVTEVLPADAPKSTKPRTGSLFRGMQMETVTLADALRLLSLPRVVGTDPESGEEITAQNGRYGPYLKRGSDSRSLQTEDQIFDVTVEEALRIYAEPKRGRGRASAAPLRELGDDPATGKPMVIKDGRFGPYVTDGEVNATLRQADTVDELTEQRAAELLAEKRAKGTTKKAPAKKTPAKKPTTKKTPAKKTPSTKKTPAKKAPAKKAPAKKAPAKKAPAKKAPAKKTPAKVEDKDSAG